MEVFCRAEGMKTTGGGKSVSRLSAQVVVILGRKRKLKRQRGLDLELGRILGRVEVARAGELRLGWEHHAGRNIMAFSQ